MSECPPPAARISARPLMQSARGALVGQVSSSRTMATDPFPAACTSAPPAWTQEEEAGWVGGCGEGGSQPDEAHGVLCVSVCVCVCVCVCVRVCVRACVCVCV